VGRGQANCLNIHRAKKRKLDAVAIVPPHSTLALNYFHAALFTNIPTPLLLPLSLARLSNEL
jgi:hypothetical protein